MLLFLTRTLDLPAEKGNAKARRIVSLSVLQFIQIGHLFFGSREGARNRALQPMPIELSSQDYTPHGSHRVSGETLAHSLLSALMHPQSAC